MDKCIDSLGEAALLLDAWGKLGPLANLNRLKQTWNDCVHELLWSFRSSREYHLGSGISPQLFKEPMALHYHPSNGSRLSCITRHSRFSENCQDNTLHLRRMLALLKDSGIPLKLKKCTFLAETLITLDTLFAFENRKFPTQRLLPSRT